MTCCTEFGRLLFQVKIKPSSFYKLKLTFRKYPAIHTNYTDKEGTTAIVEKYRNLLKKTKQDRVGQIILSGILPAFGNRIHGHRNSKRMAVNGMVKRLCKEDEVGYVDL